MVESSTYRPLHLQKWEERKPNLHGMLTKLMKDSDERMKAVETQLKDMSTVLAQKPLGTFPIQIEGNCIPFTEGESSKEKNKSMILTSFAQVVPNLPDPWRFVVRYVIGAMRFSTLNVVQGLLSI